MLSIAISLEILVASRAGLSPVAAAGTIERENTWRQRACCAHITKASAVHVVTSVEGTPSARKDGLGRAVEPSALGT